MGGTHIANVRLDMTVGLTASMLDHVAAIFTPKRLGVCLPGGVNYALDDQPSTYASVDVAEKLEQRVLGRIVITRARLGNCSKQRRGHVPIVPQRGRGQTARQAIPFEFAFGASRFPRQASWVGHRLGRVPPSPMAAMGRWQGTMGNVTLRARDKLTGSARGKQ